MVGLHFLYLNSYLGSFGGGCRVVQDLIGIDEVLQQLKHNLANAERAYEAIIIQHRRLRTCKEQYEASSLQIGSIIVCALTSYEQIGSVAFSLPLSEQSHIHPYFMYLI
jgi:hypothetical protein